MLGEGDDAPVRYDGGNAFVLSNRVLVVVWIFVCLLLDSLSLICRMHRYRLGEVFVELPADKATEMLTAATEKVTAEIAKYKEEVSYAAAVFKIGAAWSCVVGATVFC